MNKNDLENLVEDYGYFDAFPDGAAAGRASQAVEYMAILPKRGKKQALIDGAARVGVYYKPHANNSQTEKLTNV